MVAEAPKYSIAEREALQWLKIWDMHLWGINASYAQAAKMLNDKCVDAKSMASLVFGRKEIQREGDGGEIHTSYRIEWTGHCRWWKNPDEEYGPRSPTKNTAKNNCLGTRSWDRIKAHVIEHEGLFSDPNATIAFVIRHLRRARLKANVHIVTEVFNAKMMAIREVPFDSLQQMQR